MFGWVMAKRHQVLRRAVQRRHGVQAGEVLRGDVDEVAAVAAAAVLHRVREVAVQGVAGLHLDGAILGRRNWKKKERRKSKNRLCSKRQILLVVEAKKIMLVMWEIVGR